MKFKSALLTDARGSIGGATASKNHYGKFFRAKIKPVNPQSLLQIEARAILKTLAKNWKTLTAFQRAQWRQLASQLTFSDSLGDSYTLTGEALYIQNNCNLAKVGSPFIEDAPAIALNVVPYVKDFEVDSIVTPGTEDVTINFSEPIAANLKMYVESSGVVSNGIEYMKDYRFLKTLTSTDLTGVSVKSEFSTKFGELPAAGEGSFWRAHLVDINSGFTSSKITDRSIGTI